MHEVADDATGSLPSQLFSYKELGRAKQPERLLYP